MTASTTNQASEENVPKALENPLESPDTAAATQTQASERLLDATRPQSTATTTDKPLADKIAETINNVEKDPNVQSGLTKEQRTALEIQRVLREELSKKPAAERAALAQQLQQQLNAKGLPNGWKVRIGQDSTGQPAILVGKDASPSGAFREIGRVQGKDVPDPGVPETPQQMAARLAERMKGFVGNDRFVEAWMQGVTKLANDTFGVNQRGPDGPLDKFIKAFNDRLKEGDGPSNGLELARKPDGTGLVLKRPDGKTPVEVSFSTPSDTAALTRYVRATQATPADLARTLKMEGVTPLDITRKFGDVLRAEAARNPAATGDQLKTTLQTALAGTGYETRFDQTTNMLTLVKSDTNAVAGRVDYNNVKFLADGKIPPERVAGLLLEPLAAMNDVQRTNYLNRALTWLNQPGRTDAEQTAFRTALQNGIQKSPEVQNLKINGQPLALDFTDNQKLRASLDKFKPIDVMDVPVTTDAPRPPALPQNIIDRVNLINTVEGALKQMIKSNIPPDKILQSLNGSLANQPGEKLFLSTDAAGNYVLRNGPNPTDQVVGRYDPKNLQDTTDPAQRDRNLAATLARPLVGMNEEQQKAYFAQMIPLLGPNDTRRRAITTEINNIFKNDTLNPEFKGMSISENNGKLTFAKEGRTLIELPLKATPADQPATRPPVDLAAILGPDQVAKLNTPELQAAALKFFDSATPANEKLKAAEIMANGGIKSLTAKDGDKTRTLTFQKSGPYMHVYANDNGGRNTIYLRGTKRGEDYVQQVGKNGRPVGFYGDRWTKSVGKDSILGSNVSTAADRPADAPRAEVNAVTDANRMLGLTPIVANDSAAFQQRMDQQIRFTDPTDLTPKSVLPDFNAYLKASLGNPPQLDQAKAQKLAEAYSAALRAEALLNPPPQGMSPADYAAQLAAKFKAAIPPEHQNLLNVAPAKLEQGGDVVAIQVATQSGFQNLAGERADLLGKPTVAFVDMMRRAKTDGERAQIFSDMMRREKLANPVTSGNPAELVKRFQDALTATQTNDFKVDLTENGITLRKATGEVISRINPANLPTRDASGAVKENFQQLAGRLVEPLGALKGDEVKAYMQRIGASLKDVPQAQRAQLIEAIKAEMAKRPDLAQFNLAEKPDGKGLLLTTNRPGEAPVEAAYAAITTGDKTTPVAATTDGQVDLKAIVGEQQLAKLNEAQQAALRQLMKTGATPQEQLQAIESLAKLKTTPLKIKDGDKDRTLSFSVQKAGGGKSYIGLFATDDKGRSRIAIRGMNDGKNNYGQQGKASFYGTIWTRDIGNKSILTGGKANPAATQPVADQPVAVPPLFNAQKIDWNARPAENVVITPDVTQPRVDQPLTAAPPLNPEAVVNSLIDAGLTGKQDDGKQAYQERIRLMLKDFTPEQLKVVKQKFENVTGTSFDTALGQKFSGSDLNELKYLGEGLDDRTTRLIRAIQEREEWRIISGRSSEIIEKDVRDTFATMTAEQIAALEANFAKRVAEDPKLAIYKGKSLTDIITGNSSFGQSTKDAIAILKQGSDKISDDDRMKLVNLALNPSGSARAVDLFKEATRYMPADQRERLRDRMVEVAKKAASGNDQEQLIDYARLGRISTLTEIKSNLAWYGDTELGIQNALRNMPEKERADLRAGRALFDNPVANPSAEQQRQLELYKQYKEVFERAAKNPFGFTNDHEKIGYMDQALNGPNGSMVSRFLAKEDGPTGSYWGWRNRDSNGLQDIMDKPWSPEEWKMANDSATRGQLKADLLKALQANGADQTTIDKIMAQFDQRARADSVEKANQITRNIADSIKEKAGFFSSDRAGMLSAVFNMTDAQKQRLKEDPAYAAELIKSIRDRTSTAGWVFDKVNGIINPGAWLTNSLGMNISAERTFGSLTMLEADLAERAVRRYAQDPAAKPDLLDKIAQHISAGTSATEITADLEKFIKENKDNGIDVVAAFNALQGKDADLKGMLLAEGDRRFRSLTFGQNDFNAVIRPLLEKGAVDLQARANMADGWWSDDTKGFIEGLSRAKDTDFARIRENPSIVNFLGEEGKQLALKIAAQNGQLRPEDELRIAVLTGNIQRLEELSRKSPAELLMQRQAYETAFKRLLTDDLRKIHKPEADQAALAYEAPKSAMETFDNLRDIAASSADGFGLSFVRAIDSGSAVQLQARIDAFATRLTEAGVLKTEIPPEDLRKMTEVVMQAVDQYNKSEHAVAEGAIQAATIVAAIGIAIFSYGAGSGVSAALLAWALGAGAAGAVGQPLLKKALLGNDYDLNSAAAFKDAALGFITMAAAPFTPAHLARGLGVSAIFSKTGAAVLAPEIKAVATNTTANIFTAKATAQLAETAAEVSAQLVAGSADDVIRSSVQAFVHRSGAEMLDNVAAQGVSGLTRGSLEKVTQEASQALIAKAKELAARGLQPSEIQALLNTEAQNIIKASLEKVVQEAAEASVQSGVMKASEQIFGHALNSGQATSYETALKIISKEIPGITADKAAVMAQRLTMEMNQILSAASRGEIKATLEKIAAENIADPSKYQKAMYQWAMQNPLKAMVALHTLTGTTLGGVDGFARGLIEWDPSLSLSDNLQRIALSAGMGMGLGTLMGGGMTGIMNLGKIVRGESNFIRLADSHIVRAADTLPTDLSKAVKIETPNVVVEGLKTRPLEIRGNGTTGGADIIVPANVVASVDHNSGKPLLRATQGIVETSLDGGKTWIKATPDGIELQNGSLIRFGGEHASPVVFAQSGDNFVLTGKPTAESLGIKFFGTRQPDVTPTFAESPVQIVHPGRKTFTLGDLGDIPTGNSNLKASVSTEINGARVSGVIRNTNPDTIHPMKVVVNGIEHILQNGQEIRFSGSARIKGADGYDINITARRSGTVVEQLASDAKPSLIGKIAEPPVILRPGEVSANVFSRTLGDAAYVSGAALDNLVQFRRDALSMDTLGSIGSTLRSVFNRENWAEIGRRLFNSDLANSFRGLPETNLGFKNEKALLAAMTKNGFNEVGPNAAEAQRLIQAIANANKADRPALAAELAKLSRTFENSSGAQIFVKGLRITGDSNLGADAFRWNDKGLLTGFRTSPDGPYLDRPVSSVRSALKGFDNDHIDSALIRELASAAPDRPIDGITLFAFGGDKTKFHPPLSTADSTRMAELLAKAKRNSYENIELKRLQATQKLWADQIKKVSTMEEALTAAGPNGKVFYVRNGDAPLDFSDANIMRQLFDSGNFRETFNSPSNPFRSAGTDLPWQNDVGYVFQVTDTGVKVTQRSSFTGTANLSRTATANHSATKTGARHILRDNETLDVGSMGNEIRSKFLRGKYLSLTRAGDNITANGEFLVIRNGVYTKVRGSEALHPGDVIVVGKDMGGRLVKGEAFLVDKDFTLQNIKSGLIYAAPGGPRVPYSAYPGHLSRTLSKAAVQTFRSVLAANYAAPFKWSYRNFQRAAEYIRDYKNIQRRLDKGLDGTTIDLKAKGKIEIVDGFIKITANPKEKILVRVADKTHTIEDGSFKFSTEDLRLGAAFRFKDSGREFKLSVPKSQREYVDTTWSSMKGFRMKEHNPDDPYIEWAPVHRFKRNTENIDDSVQIQLIGHKRAAIKNLGVGENADNIYIRPLNSPDAPFKQLARNAEFIPDGPVLIKIGDRTYQFEHVGFAGRKIENAALIYSMLPTISDKFGFRTINALRMRAGNLADSVVGVNLDRFANGTYRFERTFSRNVNTRLQARVRDQIDLTDSIHVRVNGDKTATVMSEGKPIEALYVQRSSLPKDHPDFTRNPLKRNSFVRVENAELKKGQAFKTHEFGDTYTWNGKQTVTRESQPDSLLKAPTQSMRVRDTAAVGMNGDVTKSKYTNYGSIELKDGKPVTFGRSRTDDVVIAHSSVKNDGPHITATSKLDDSGARVLEIETTPATIANNSQTFIRQADGAFSELPGGKTNVKAGDVIRIGKHDTFEVVQNGDVLSLKQIRVSKETSDFLRFSDRPKVKSEIERVSEVGLNRALKRYSERYAVRNGSDTTTPFSNLAATISDDLKVVATPEGFTVTNLNPNKLLFIKRKGATDFEVARSRAFVNPEDQFAVAHSIEEIGGLYSVFAKPAEVVTPRRTIGQLGRDILAFAKAKGTEGLKFSSDFYGTARTTIGEMNFGVRHTTRWANKFEMTRGNKEALRFKRGRLELDNSASIRATDNGFEIRPSQSPQQKIFLEVNGEFIPITEPITISPGMRIRIGENSAPEITLTLTKLPGAWELPSRVITKRNALNSAKVAGAGAMMFTPAAPLVPAYLVYRGIRHLNRAYLRQWANHFALSADDTIQTFGRGVARLEGKATVRVEKDGFRVTASGKNDVSIRRADGTLERVDGVAKLGTGDSVVIGNREYKLTNMGDAPDTVPPRPKRFEGVARVGRGIVDRFKGMHLDERVKSMRFSDRIRGLFRRSESAENVFKAGKPTDLEGLSILNTVGEHRVSDNSPLYMIKENQSFRPATTGEAPEQFAFKIVSENGELKLVANSEGVTVKRSARNKSASEKPAEVGTPFTLRRGDKISIKDEAGNVTEYPVDVVSVVNGVKAPYLQLKSTKLPVDGLTVYEYKMPTEGMVLGPSKKSHIDIESDSFKGTSATIKPTDDAKVYELKIASPHDTTVEQPPIYISRNALASEDIDTLSRDAAIKSATRLDTSANGGATNVRPGDLVIFGDSGRAVLVGEDGSFFRFTLPEKALRTKAESGNRAFVQKVLDGAETSSVENLTRAMDSMHFDVANTQKLVKYIQQNIKSFGPEDLDKLETFIGKLQKGDKDFIATEAKAFLSDALNSITALREAGAALQRERTLLLSALERANDQSRSNPGSNILTALNLLKDKPELLNDDIVKQFSKLFQSNRISPEDAELIMSSIQSLEKQFAQAQTHAQFANLKRATPDLFADNVVVKFTPSQRSAGTSEQLLGRVGLMKQLSSDLRKAISDLLEDPNRDLTAVIAKIREIDKSAFPGENLRSYIDDALVSSDPNLKLRITMESDGIHFSFPKEVKKKLEPDVVPETTPHSTPPLTGSNTATKARPQTEPEPQNLARPSLDASSNTAARVEHPYERIPTVEVPPKAVELQGQPISRVVLSNGTTMERVGSKEFIVNKGTPRESHWHGDIRYGADGTPQFVNSFEKFPNQVNLEVIHPDGRRIVINDNGTSRYFGAFLGLGPESIEQTAARLAKELNLDPEIIASRLQLSQVGKFDETITTRYALRLTAQEAEDIEKLVTPQSRLRFAAKDDEVLAHPTPDELKPISTKHGARPGEDPGEYVYRQPMPDHTATTAMFFEDGGELYVVLGERGKEPFKGKNGLIGGFGGREKNADNTLGPLEHVEQSGTREFREETMAENVKPHIVRVSDALMDNRNRIIDYQMLYFGTKEQFESMRAADPLDVKKLSPIRVSEVLRDNDLAFDHVDALKAALSAFVKETKDAKALVNLIDHLSETDLAIVLTKLNSEGAISQVANMQAVIAKLKERLRLGSYKDKSVELEIQGVVSSIEEKFNAIELARKAPDTSGERQISLERSLAPAHTDQPTARVKLETDVHVGRLDDAPVEAIYYAITVSDQYGGLKGAGSFYSESYGKLLPEFEEVFGKINLKDGPKKYDHLPGKPEVFLFGNDTYISVNATNVSGNSPSKIILKINGRNISEQERVYGILSLAKERGIKSIGFSPNSSSSVDESATLAIAGIRKFQTEQAISSETPIAAKVVLKEKSHESAFQREIQTQTENPAQSELAMATFALDRSIYAQTFESDFSSFTMMLESHLKQALKLNNDPVEIVRQMNSLLESAKIDHLFYAQVRNGELSISFRKASGDWQNLDVLPVGAINPNRSLDMLTPFMERAEDAFRLFVNNQTEQGIDALSRELKAVILDASNSGVNLYNIQRIISTGISDLRISDRIKVVADENAGHLTLQRKANIFAEDVSIASVNTANATTRTNPPVSTSSASAMKLQEILSSGNLDKQAIAEVDKTLGNLLRPILHANHDEGTMGAMIARFAKLTKEEQLRIVQKLEELDSLTDMQTKHAVWLLSMSSQHGEVLTSSFNLLARLEGGFPVNWIQSAMVLGSPEIESNFRQGLLIALPWMRQPLASKVYFEGLRLSSNKPAFPLDPRLTSRENLGDFLNYVSKLPPGEDKANLIASVRRAMEYDAYQDEKSISAILNFAHKNFSPSEWNETREGFFALINSRLAENPLRDQVIAELTPELRIALLTNGLDADTLARLTQDLPQSILQNLSKKLDLVGWSNKSIDPEEFRLIGAILSHYQSNTDQAVLKALQQGLDKIGTPNGLNGSYKLAGALVEELLSKATSQDVLIEARAILNYLKNKVENFATTHGNSLESFNNSAEIKAISGIASLLNPKYSQLVDQEFLAPLRLAARTNETLQSFVQQLEKRLIEFRPSLSAQELSELSASTHIVGNMFLFDHQGIYGVSRQRSAVIVPDGIDNGVNLQLHRATKGFHEHQEALLNGRSMKSGEALATRSNEDFNFNLVVFMNQGRNEGDIATVLFNSFVAAEKAGAESIAVPAIGLYAIKKYMSTADEQFASRRDALLAQYQEAVRKFREYQATNTNARLEHINFVFLKGDQAEAEILTKAFSSKPAQRQLSSERSLDTPIRSSRPSQNSEPTLARTDATTTQNVNLVDSLAELRQSKHWNETIHKPLLEDIFSARTIYMSQKADFENAVSSHIRAELTANPTRDINDIVREIWQAVNDANNPLNRSGRNFFDLRARMLHSDIEFSDHLGSLRSNWPAIHSDLHEYFNPLQAVDPFELRVSQLVGSNRYYRPSVSEIADMKRLLPGFDENSAVEFFAIFDRTDSNWLRDRSHLATDARRLYEDVSNLWTEVTHMRSTHTALENNPAATQTDIIQSLANLRQKEIELKTLQIQQALVAREIENAVGERFAIIHNELSDFLEKRNLLTDFAFDEKTEFGGYYGRLNLTVGARSFLSPMAFQDLPRIIFHELVHHHQLMSSARLSIQEVLSSRLTRNASHFGDIDEALVQTYINEIKQNFRARRGSGLTNDQILQVLRWSKNEPLLDKDFIDFVRTMDKDFKYNSGHAYTAATHKESAKIIARKILKMEGKWNSIKSDEVENFINELKLGTPMDAILDSGKLKKRSHGGNLAERIFGTRKLPREVLNIIRDETEHWELSADGKSKIFMGYRPISSLPEKQQELVRQSNEYYLMEALRRRLAIRRGQSEFYNQKYYNSLKERFAYGLDTQVMDLNQRRFNELTGV